MKESFAKHFAILASGTVANMVLGLLTTPIITRLVDPSSYGFYSLFSVYANIAVGIVCLGLDQSLARFFYTNEDAGYRRSLLKTCYVLPNVIWAAVSIIAMVAALLVVGEGLSPDDERSFLPLFVLYVFILILNRNASFVLRLNYESKKLSFSVVLNKIVFAGSAIALLVLSGGDHGRLILTVSLALGMLVISVYQVFCRKDDWRIKDVKMLPHVELAEVVKYGLPFIFSGLIGTMFAASDRVFISIFLTEADVGIYAAAISIVHLFSVIQTSLNTIWMPTAIEHYETDPEDRELYIKAANYVAISMLLLGITVVLFKDVLALLLGVDYREAAFVIPFLCFNPIFYTMSETTVMGIYFMKKSSYHVLVAGVSLVVNVVLNLLLTPVLGIRGAAMATAGSYVVFFMLRTVLSNRLYPIDYKLGRLAVCGCLLTAFSAWNTFSPFVPPMLVAYVICIGVVLALYRESVISGAKIVWRKVSGTLQRGNGDE